MKARSKKRYIYLCSYYIPNWNLNDIARLDESLKQATNRKKEKRIILAGDFNREKVSVSKAAADREVQEALLDVTIEHGLSQVNDQPTRDNNLLDLVFTNNPSIMKTSTSLPGISDHAMVVTDIDIIPQAEAAQTIHLLQGILGQDLWWHRPAPVLPLLQQWKIYGTPSNQVLKSLWT